MGAFFQCRVCGQNKHDPFYCHNCGAVHGLKLSYVYKSESGEVLARVYGNEGLLDTLRHDRLSERIKELEDELKNWTENGFQDDLETRIHELEEKNRKLSEQYEHVCAAWRSLADTIDPEHTMMAHDAARIMVDELKRHREAHR